MRAMQSFYKEVGLKDIPWNFVIGDDGYIYEARGFHYEGEIPLQGETSTFENLGVHIAFMGTFVDREPSPGQEALFNAFLDNSVRRDMLRSDFVLLVEDQLTLAIQIAEGVFNVSRRREPEFYSSMKVKKLKIVLNFFLKL